MQRRRHWILGSAAAVLAPAFLRDVRAAGVARDVSRFALGVASGQPSERGMVLWTRLVGADLPPQVPVRWEVAHDERFERIAEADEETARAGFLNIAGGCCGTTPAHIAEIAKRVGNYRPRSRHDPLFSGLLAAA